MQLEARHPRHLRRRKLAGFGDLTIMIRNMKCFLQTLRMHICHSRNIWMPVTCLCNHMNQSLFPLTLKYSENKLWYVELPRNTIAARFFSSKDMLSLEQEQWTKSSARYMDLAAHFKKRLEIIHDKYSDMLETPLIRVGDFTYFEEDRCIFRSRPSDGHVENVLSFDDLGFSVGRVQRIRISPDQQHMAVSVASTDSEETLCLVVNLQNFPEVEHWITNAFSFEWASNDVLFYTEQENVRCRRVFLCDFRKERDTKLVYTEQNPRFFVDLSCTQDKRFLTINSNSKTTSEVWLVDCNRPSDSPILVQQRTAGVIYHVEHRDDMLYVLTTLGKNKEYKLMKTPLGARSLENWKLICKVKEKAKLVDLEMRKDHCIMFLKHYNYLYLTVISLVTESVVFSTQLPAWACAFESGNFYGSSSSTSLAFHLSSPVKPPVRFVYSLVENKLFVEAPEDVQNSKNVCTTRLEAESKDGTLVPITVFHKPCEGLNKKPVLVHVYGAYGIDLSMNFKPEKLLLIEDGWILAYCHVRGGGELGHRWHEDGRLEKKRNGLDDLNACILRLHELGYSEPSFTALTAASAGGVLAGALCNNDPLLIRAMVLQAPFLDVLNTMLDTSLPLTIEEQEEWGNPLLSEMSMQYIKSYCPHQNIKLKNYPSVLITANEHDQRIPLYGLLKYVDRLRKSFMEYSSIMDKEVVLKKVYWPITSFFHHPGIGQLISFYTFNEEEVIVILHLGRIH